MKQIITLLFAAGMTLAAFAQTPSTVGVALQPRTSRVVGTGTNLFMANADRAVATVDTVARLATLTNAVHGAVVDVRGYATDADWPVPLRYQLATNSAAATNRFVIANAGGSGRWIHEWSGAVDAFVLPGVTNSAAIQSALDYAASVNKPAVFRGTYYLDAPITNNGVHMIGMGASLVRRFWIPTGNTSNGGFDSDKRHAIQLGAGSILQDFTIDGGADQTTISQFGASDAHGTYFWMNMNGVINQTQYGDVAIIGASPQSPVRIEGCTFRNSPGSCVRNQENSTTGVRIINNVVSGYYDHAFYFTGWPSLQTSNYPASDITISGNLISVTNQTRANTAIKLRNLVSRALIANNTLYLTNDIAISLDGGDSVGGNGNLGPVSIIGNVGTARYFMSFSDISTNLTDSWNVRVENNNIDIYNTGVTGYVLGTSPAATGPSGVCVFRNNSFKTTDPDSYAYLLPAGYNTPSALVEPTTYSITDNFFNGLFLIQPYGRFQLDLSRNTLIDRRGPSTNNYPFLINVSTATPNNLPSGTSIPWTIDDNVFINYAAIIFDSDSSTNSGNNLLAGHRLTMRRNRMLGHPLSGWLLNWRGNSISNYSGANFVVAEDNICASVLGSFNTLPQTKLRDSWNSTINNSTSLRTKVGTLTVGDTNQTSALAVTASAGSVAQILLQDAGITRVEFRKTGNGELQVIRRNSSGTFLSTPIWIGTNGFVGINDQTSPGVALDVLGDIGVGNNNTNGQYVVFRGASGYQRMTEYRSAALTRWRVGVNNTTEVGNNFGSDFDFLAYSDHGADTNVISVPMARLARSTNSDSTTPLYLPVSNVLRRVVITNEGGVDRLILAP